MTRRAAGFTLIELMIGLVLGLVVISAVLSVWLGSRRSYRTDEALARLQESTRLAYEFIARGVRAAGYYGCYDGSELINTLNDPTAYFANFGLAVSGHEGVDGDWNPALPQTFDNIDVRQGSDLLTLRGVFGNSTTLDRVMPSVSADLKSVPTGEALFQPGDIVVISDCVAASVFQINNYTVANGNIVHNTGNSVSPGNATKNLGHRYPPGSRIMQIDALSFYVRDDEEPPALHRKQGGDPSVELVEGIEDMQLRYGVDLDGDRSADEYRSATAVADWQSVVSVEVSLLARSLEDRVVAEPQRFRFNGEDVTAGDRRLRFPSTYVVALRNKLQ